MGYCIEQRDSRFTLKAENKANALLAIKALAGLVERMNGGNSSGDRWFSWVDTEEFVTAKTLAEATDAWGWGISEDSKTGDVMGIYFDGEKLGDDRVMLEAIAPYVEKGSYIEMEGEDGAIWKWVFDGKTMREKLAKMSWE